MAELKPELDTSVHVIFIASEECWHEGVGVDEMMKRGDCNHVLGGVCGLLMLYPSMDLAHSRLSTLMRIIRAHFLLYTVEKRRETFW